MNDLPTLLHDQRLVVIGGIHLVELFQTMVPSPPSPTDWSGPASVEYVDLLATLGDGLAKAAADLHGARADLDSAIQAIAVSGSE